MHTWITIPGNGIRCTKCGESRKGYFTYEGKCPVPILTS